MDYTLQEATADKKPPALPIKLRRHSSSTSSASDLQLEGTLNLPVSSPLPSPSIDVFAPSTDCNAAQCPIHHHYGCHQERFFSDQTPPPIPKKRLARTLSLPAGTTFTAGHVPMSSHCCENPPNIFEDSPLECSGEEKKEKAHCYNQFTFDTPDQHLPGYFSSFCHQEHVYVGIQNRYIDFMKNAVKRLEATVLLGEQQVEQVRKLQPQDFVLCENLHSEKTDSVYFMAYIPKVPEGLFAVKVNRNDFLSTCPMPLPPHPNVEEAVGHFLPCITQEKHQLSTLLTATEASRISHEGSAEPWQESNIITKGHTVLSFLERGLTVTVVRDFPQGTLEDFVQEGISLHCSLPDVYERRLCLLILQLALGLQHLESHNARHAELTPQRIMLAWVQPKNKRAVEKAEDIRHPKGVKEGNRFPEWRNMCLDLLHENRSLIRVHTLWGKSGTPHVVISHKEDHEEPSEKASSSGLQLGALLKHGLHLHMDLQQNTEYTPGLLYLINQLSGETPGLQMAEIAGVLQALLWGPQAGLFEKNQPNTTVLHNWLMVKRSLLVLKLAEKGLFLNKSDLDWEEYLCLQYFALAEPEAVLKTTAQLGLYNNVRLV